MKKIVCMLICMIAARAQAQLAVEDTVSHVSATVYAGTLAGPKVAIQDGKTTSFYTLRAGGTIAWMPSKWLTAFGVAGGEITHTNEVVPIGIFGFKLKPWKRIAVSVGKIASPAAEIRPLPISAASQFEPWTLAQLPASALGAKVTCAPHKNLSFVAGNFWRGKEASLEAGMTYKHVSCAGWYMNQSKLYGVALDFSFEKFRTVIQYTDTQSIGMFTVVNVPKIPNLRVYSDMGFHPVTGKCIRGEWGFLQTSTTGVVKFLLGLGYSQEIRSFKGYVFVHL